MCVAEHPEQEPTGLLPGPDPVPQVAPKPELEEAAAELPPKLGPADRDAEPLEHDLHRVAERLALRERELLAQPMAHRSVPALVLVELERVRRHSAGSHHGALSLTVEAEPELLGGGRLLLQVCCGLSVSAEDGGPAIVVNTQDRISVERWIFSAAHELGHLLLHLDSYDIAKASEEADEEKEANVFASYFLMPEQLFAKEWDETRGLPFVNRVLKVKRMFRVSYLTVLHRLIDQHPEHFPRDSTYAMFAAAFRRQFGRGLTRHDEPDKLGPESFMAPEPLKGREPEQLSACDFQEDKLSALVRRGIEEGVISMSRGGEILGKSMTEMRELTMAWVA